MLGKAHAQANDVAAKPRSDLKAKKRVFHALAQPQMRDEARVRAAGSWKQYCRRDHKQILRLRSLIARGRARERLATSRAMKFIVRQGDNGIVWTILSFWRATN